MHASHRSRSAEGIRPAGKTRAGATGEAARRTRQGGGVMARIGKRRAQWGARLRTAHRLLRTEEEGFRARAGVREAGDCESSPGASASSESARRARQFADGTAAGRSHCAVASANRVEERNGSYSASGESQPGSNGEETASLGTFIGAPIAAPMRIAMGAPMNVPRLAVSSPL